MTLKASKYTKTLAGRAHPCAKLRLLSHWGIISIRLVCACAEEKKAGHEEEKSQEVYKVYFTYAWSDPYRSVFNQNSQVCSSRQRKEKYKDSSL